jgi:hypothetical protein
MLPGELCTVVEGRHTAACTQANASKSRGTRALESACAGEPGDATSAHAAVNAVTSQDIYDGRID